MNGVWCIRGWLISRSARWDVRILKGQQLATEWSKGIDGSLRYCTRGEHLVMIDTTRET